MQRLKRLMVVTSVMILNTSALASGKISAPPDPTYVQECGSCHAPYPARLLSGSSWQALVTGLNQHFGVDASLDANAAAEISRYLEGNARRKETIAGDGRPILRITETRWFRHEHGEVPEATWKLPAVKSAANCAACHRSAEQGRYSEHDIHIPR